MASQPPPAALDVREIERRMRWRMLPAVVFVCLLGGLLAGGILSLVSPPRRIAGLPVDPDLERAARAVRGALVLPPAGLRFECALSGESPVGTRPVAGLDARIAAAESLVGLARTRRPGDARIAASLAALDLARHRYGDAERHYRSALARNPAYPEARLGLGVALALRAEVEPEPLVRRRLRLEAIAQFAAVAPADPLGEEALYNRAILLEEVGRTDEARSLAVQYLARDPAGPWAEVMRAIAAE